MRDLIKKGEDATEIARREGRGHGEPAPSALRRLAEGVTTYEEVAGHHGHGLSRDESRVRQGAGLLVKAGWRLIALETFEEERALATRKPRAQACKRELVTWSSPRGWLVRKRRGVARRRLRAISAAAEPAIFAILDAHRQLHDPVALRRLRDLLSCSPSACSRSCCSAPRSIFLELTHEAAIVELPLPKAGSTALPRRDRVARQGGARGAVRAALGLTADEALRVFRKSCALAGGLNEKAVGLIVREKRQALRRIPRSPSTSRPPGSTTSAGSAS